jgi:hypothetical protein
MSRHGENALTRGRASRGLKPRDAARRAILRHAPPTPISRLCALRGQESESTRSAEECVEPSALGPCGHLGERPIVIDGWLLVKRGSCCSVFTCCSMLLAFVWWQIASMFRQAPDPVKTCVRRFLPFPDWKPARHRRLPNASHGSSTAS